MCTLGDAADVNPVIKLQRVSQEFDYRIDNCRVIKDAHIEHRKETWSISPSVDMVPFGVTIPATVPQGSEMSEGLMNDHVFRKKKLSKKGKK
jgi:hypothetical protein